MSATPSKATAISVANQADFSPRHAPNNTSARTPAARMNSGSTVGKEKAVGVSTNDSSKSCGLGHGQRLVEALYQRVDRSRAGVDNRLRVHAIVYCQCDKRSENCDFDPVQIGDRHQIWLVDDPEDYPSIEIKRISRRKDKPGRREQRHPTIDLERPDQR